ncbi:MAG: hypothetical protein KOO62_10600 [candidate division Zixibacteria bacterium]|nr:hypothetical protein [candidate division Zixibacteria bacterium]
MNGMIHDCLLEMVDRKAIWMFVVVTIIAALIIVATSSFSAQFEIEGQPDVDPLGGVIDVAATKGLASHLGFMMFLAVFATAGIIPNMLVRGRAEYYLSKPISRTTFYLGRLVSIWLVYGATIVVCGLVTLLLLYLSHGYSNANVVYLFVECLFSYFIWLSITTCAGIVFGSTALAMMTAFLTYVLQIILSFHEVFHDFVGDKAIAKVGDFLYYIFPKTGEIGEIGESLAMGETVGSWMPVWSSLLFALALIWTTVLVFNRKDY